MWQLGGVIFPLTINGVKSTFLTVASLRSQVNPAIKPLTFWRSHAKEFPEGADMMPQKG
jgi:hypothetical protein